MRQDNRYLEAKDEESFLEMCRLAASEETGGQWTDEKIDAIEAVELAPRDAVRRLFEMYTEEQAQLATAQQRDEQRRVLLDDAQVLARDAQRRAADAEIALAIVTQDYAALTREVAGLRYYIAQLERRLPPAQRQAAADEASAALASITRPR